MRVAIVSLVIALAVGCRRDSESISTSAKPASEVQLEAPVRQLHEPPAAPASARSFYASFKRKPPVAELTELGALAFRDPSLSASGKLACASCHDPDHALAPSNDRAVQLGGATGTLTGTRATPTLRYLQTVPRFTEHYREPDDDNDSLDQGPAGGLTWDGRAQTTHEQASAPLLSPVEMANASEDDVVRRLRAAPYAARFRAAFGDEPTLPMLVLALEVYQQDPATFYPYTSKFDAVMRHEAQLSPQEARGKAVFDDASKGNCASCHPDTISSGFPAFTDFGYVAVGVPRNRAIAANKDPAFFDLGLCGPYRRDLTGRSEYCGMFRTPTLRNVARKKRFMHNGVFTSLTQVVQFYATRDSEPKRWYAGGEPFDDLPAAYKPNVNREAPFGGKTPVLSDADVVDLVAFLGTLDDGYRP